MLFSSKDDYGLSKGTKLEGLRPAYQPRYANSRTWGTPTELRQPQQQLPFIASLTCPRKSFARDDKFVATLISNHLRPDLTSCPDTKHALFRGKRSPRLSQSAQRRAH